MDDKHQTVASDEKEAKQPIAMNEEEEDIEALAEPPDWLPDGWIMEVYHAEDDTINYYYTSPISNCTFSKKSEVLEYLFSRTDERILELNKFGVEKEITFQREQEWLPKGWVMEVRAGGEKMDKMYKFYVYPETGVRLLSKQDVILNEAKISQCDTNRQCDTSSKDNLLAIVDFHPSGLPEGWVKELAFRKIKEGLIRRDPYYTDPVSSYTLRTLKSVLCFIKTGKVPKRAFIQMINVHDLYSFDESAPLCKTVTPQQTRIRIHHMIKKKKTSQEGRLHAKKQLAQGL
ncbi:hypothetical protein C2845_PM01G36300 [Panicum miliaceum]|uniref:MBD domain-containing protein n=1 Tax=Panicum miliaceum TaxID=4540 RepID=A0A3L6TIP7_PANMI|nr:hypothetical protein C2845_PM01G36300 [Panicum miliaceum]